MLVNGHIITRQSSVVVIKKRLHDHLFDYAPRVQTPYGMNLDLHLVEEGNGTWAIRQWTQPYPLATGLSREKAESYLFGHLQNLFSKSQNPWKIYYTSSVEAFACAIELQAEYEGIPASEILRRKNTVSLHPKHEEIPPELIRGYENIIPPIQGESHKDTVKRLSKTIGRQLPTEQFFAILKHIRQQNYLTND